MIKRKTTAYNICSEASNCMKSDNPNSGIYETDTTRTLDLNGGNPSCAQGGTMIVEDKAICLQGGGVTSQNSQGSGINEDVAFTLNATDRHAVFDSQVYHGCKEFTDGISQTVNAQYGTGGNNQPLVVERTALSIGNGQTNNISMSDKANALDTMHDQQAVMQSQTFGVDSESLIGSSLKARNDGSSNCDVVISALCADDYKGPNRQYVDGGKCQITNNIVRRLTPLEAERLQGYPDRWTDVPGASDSKRYKALGNSIALPFWEHLAHRFVEIGKVKIIGSLFDGIGGFPLVFKRAGAETKWTSEIEPFCEAVVKYHLDNGDL